MDNHLNEKISYFNKLSTSYFKKLILLNCQYENSIYFMVLVQIIRFMFGHSQVYSIFYIANQQAQFGKGQIFSQLQKQLKTSVVDNIYYFKILLIGLSLVSTFSLVLFFIKQNIQKKYKPLKIIYYISHIIQASNQLIFSMFGIIIYLVYLTSNYLWLIVIIPTILFNILFFKITAIFLQKNSFESQDVYSHTLNIKLEIVNIAFCLLTFLSTILAFIETNFIVHYAIVFFWFTLQALRIKYSLVQTYYEKQSTNYCYMLVVCVQTIQMVVTTVGYYTKLSLIKQNTLFLIILMSVFVYWSVINYYTHVRQESYFWQVEDIKSSQDIYLLFNSNFNALRGLSSNDSSQMGLIVSSIKKNHQNNCKISQCFCHQNIELNDFFKNYIIYQLKKIQHQYQSSRQVILFFINFKFYVLSFYSQIQQQIRKYKHSYNLNYLQKYLILRLSSQVKVWIKQQNKKIQSIKIDAVLKFQQQMHQINDIIMEDISLKYKKWNLLTKKLCKVNQVSQLSQKQISCLVKMEQIKQNKWDLYSRSLAFNAILYFYYKKVTLKVNELNKFQQNIMELSRKIKEQQMIKSHVFIKNLLHKKSCTFQSSIEKNSMGMILQASKSVSNVFGYNQHKIIGQNINCLIPKFIVHDHQQLMEKWVQNGSNFASTKISDIFCLHKQNYVFTALKYFKIHASIDGVYLITTFYKKNDNDLIIIDGNFLLQSYGKNFKSILKHIPLNINVDFIFKNLRKKIKNAVLNQQKEGFTIIYNQPITRQLMQNKKQSNEQNGQKFILGSKQSLGKYIPQTTIQHDDIWKMQFRYKMMKIKSTTFYLVQAKVLEYIQYCDEEKSKIQQNYDNISQLQGNIQNQKNQLEQQIQINLIHQQQNSSMTSIHSQLGYGISKMIIQFSQILFYPQKLQDKRSIYKLIGDVTLYSVLLIITFSTLMLNKMSLDDKTTILKAKANVDRTFHLQQVTVNHIYNAYMYRKNLDLQKIAIDQNANDSQKFADLVNLHLAKINSDLSPLKQQHLYSYLSTPTNWTFASGNIQQIELLQFFKNTHYASTIIKDQLNKKFINQTANFTLTTQMFTLLGKNIVALRTIRQTLNSLTQQSLANDASLNQTVFYISMTLIAAFSLIYGAFAHKNYSFRHNQYQNQIDIYKMVPQQMLFTLKQYYLMYYNHFVLSSIRIDNILINSKPLKFDKQLQQPNYQKQSNKNHIKYIGYKRYWVWILIVVLVIMLNVGNFLMEYNMYKFNKEIQFFSKITISISQSQSILLNRLIRLKAVYYFDKNRLNQQFLDFMLRRVEIQQVAFNQFVTFGDNQIIDSDQNFRTQFNQLLVRSPCELNKQSMTSSQIAVCKNFTKLGQNGIITFVNGFSRLMRNTFLYWKTNLTAIMKQTDYLSTRTQFMELDFALTFHVETIYKIGMKIISAYQNGFMNQYQTCIIIFIMVLVVQTAVLVWNIRGYYKDRKTLANLYGYVLLIPSVSLKHSKYLVKFLQNNLQFQQKY